MVKDSKGQVSLEYLLILVVSLMILIVFTLPLMEDSIKMTLDVSDSLKVKSDLSDIVSAITTVYNEGQGSKQTVHIQSKEPIKVNVGSDYVSANVGLHDHKYKAIGLACKSNLKSSSINLKKGNNIIVVEWPVNDENMSIFTSF